jgi:hypothetical protein
MQIFLCDTLHVATTQTAALECIAYSFHGGVWAMPKPPLSTQQRTPQPSLLRRSAWYFYFILF